MTIYGIRIQTVEQIPSEFVRYIMPKRYERALNYLRKADRMRCLGAGLLMHRVLGIEERELQYGAYGKPYVPGKAEFSISHGENWAILSADRHPVGVDIEPMNNANLSVARRVFTAEELAWMQQDPLPRFHILWTIKESIMKATGLGLQLDPAQFHVLPIDGPNCVNGQKWYTAWTLHEDCAVACASANIINSLKFEEIIY